MKQRMLRSEVPVELTWNLEDIFRSVEAWEVEMSAIASDLQIVIDYCGKLAQGASVLLACLDAWEGLMERISRVHSYAFLHLSADGADAANQAAMGRAAALLTKFQAETAFIQTEILALPEATIERYLREESALNDFRRLFEKLRAERAHMLAAETEMALASLGEVLIAPWTIYQRSKAADLAFEPVQDGVGEVHPMSFAVYTRSYERSPDIVLRRNAYASFVKGLQSFRNTYAATWGTEAKKQVILAKLRGYASATEMILAKQEVTPEIYHNLHDIAFREMAAHMRRYAKLRKRMLGLDRLLYCDVEAPLDPDFIPTVSYEQGAELILGGLSVLGPEYSAIISDALHNRWIDRADNVGKASDWFCGTISGVHSYVLVTWTDSMRDVLTLSHELGHAGQGMLSSRAQRLNNRSVSRFFVEAPSTLSELLVGNYLAAQAEEPRMHRWLAMQILTTYHHNFVRHLIEGELQRRIYVLAEQGQPITAALLDRVQGEILEEFWGGEVEIDDGARLTWMRQPHYYSGLYSYTYVAGLTIGTSVAQAIRDEGQSAAERWLRVLRAGDSLPPLELARLAGVDMSTAQAIRRATNYVGSLVDQVDRGFPSELPAL